MSGEQSKFNSNDCLNSASPLTVTASNYVWRSCWYRSWRNTL